MKRQLQEELKGLISEAINKQLTKKPSMNSVEFRSRLADTISHVVETFARAQVFVFAWSPDGYGLTINRDDVVLLKPGMLVFLGDGAQSHTLFCVSSHRDSFKVLTESGEFSMFSLTFHTHLSLVPGTLYYTKNNI